MRFRRFAFICALLLFLLPASTTTIRAQSTTSPSAQQRPTSAPYTGDLSIFESEGRDQRLHIDGVMKALAITPGKNVADIGAGSGWFTVRAARKVKTRVWCMLSTSIPMRSSTSTIASRRIKLQNVKTILGKAGNPELPPDSIDAVLLLKTYHEVSQPVELLRNLRSSLCGRARASASSIATATAQITVSIRRSCCTKPTRRDTDCSRSTTIS